MINLRANIKLLILISAVFLPFFCFGVNAIYHPNGKLAWEGGNAYHSNGKIAWYGYKGSNVYHSNGQVAWYGYKDSSCYDQNGKYVGNANNIWISLGNGSWLYVSAEEGDILFQIDFFLGTGFYLQTVEEIKHYLNIYENQIDL